MVPYAIVVRLAQVLLLAAALAGCATLPPGANFPKTVSLALVHPEETRGQTAVVSRYGNFALHAKLFVFDRRKIFMGSMNFDQRSKRLNTEVGLIIDSVELAQQTAARFDAMVRPENSYALALRPRGAAGPPRLVWRTTEGAESIEYAREPAQRLAKAEGQTHVVVVDRQGAMNQRLPMAGLILVFTLVPVTRAAPPAMAQTETIICSDLSAAPAASFIATAAGTTRNGRRSICAPSISGWRLAIKSMQPKTSSRKPPRKAA
jgi:hypothetical protein